MYHHTFVLALTLATGLGSPLTQSVDSKETEDVSKLSRLQMLMDAYLNWAPRALYNVMKTPFNDLKNVPIMMQGGPFKADLNIEYLKFEDRDYAKPVVDKFYIDPHTLDSTFRLSVPHTSTTAKYKLNGTCLGHQVAGEGHLTYGTKDFSVTVSDLKFHDDPRSLRVTSMNVAFNKGDMKIKFDGLEVAGMSLDDFEEEMKSRIIYFIDIMTHRSTGQGDAVKTEVNSRIAGRSLEKMVQWFNEQSKEISYK